MPDIPSGCICFLDKLHDASDECNTLFCLCIFPLLPAQTYASRIEEDFFMQNIVKLGSIGLVTGIVNGLLGIGGGTILIPAMIFLLGEKQHKAHGTSLAIILPTAVISAAVYYFHDNLDIGLTLKVVSGAVIGGYIGAKLMNKIPAKSLKKIFGIFMVLAGLRMVF
jgi:uncharacterized membrane protein YfcA